jgi:glycosyltransferase involved in cell wall biosynthesis
VIRVLHIITGLNTGGAEMMLLKLLSRINRAAFESSVVSLTDSGPIGRRIQELGVPVRVLGMSRGTPNPVRFLRLVAWLRQDHPCVVQTWMYHADLIGGLAATMAGGLPLAWGVQNSTLHPKHSKRTTRWTARTCARLSRWLPDRIVCCSEAVRQVHQELGYTADRMIVIPNGVDPSEFVADPIARASVRHELKLSDQTVLIGMVSRFDAQKDHRNFIEAARLLSIRQPETHFLLCGDGIDSRNEELVGWIAASGIQDRCHLVGRRADIPRINAALDIASLSSAYGEGLPVAIIEAMASRLPCVVTDVGGCGFLVADTGKVVPVKSPIALAQAWRELIEAGPDKRKHLGLAALHRIAQFCDLSDIVRQYENLYRELAKGTNPVPKVVNGACLQYPASFSGSSGQRK